MKRLKILFAMLLATIALSLTVVVAACKSSDPSLNLSDEELSLYVGETHTLTVDVTEINENLSWASSDEAVIKIEPSEDGKSAVVTSLQAGNADITVSASGISATCSVTSNDVTDINSIEIRYDGSSTPSLKKGDLLAASKLSAQVSGASLTYRYTIKFGEDEESELNSTYTLAEKGTYIVTAYVTARGYTGSDTLEIKVADELTDLSVSCGLNDPIYVGSILKTTDVSCSSASVSSLEFGYNVTFPDGSKKAFDKDMPLSQTGDYEIEAYINNNSEWFGTATKTINVKEKVSLTDKMSLTYDEAAAENTEHNIDLQFDFSKFALVVTDRPSEVTDENIVWKLNGEDFNPSSQSSYTFGNVGKYVLTVSINHENYSGEKSVEIVVYKNHTVTLTGSETAIIDKAFTYSYSATQGIELRLEVSYDNGETYSLYNGTFTQSGNATIRAKVVDANNYNRGEATKNITVYAIGSALDVKNELVTLYMGITQTVSGSAVSNLNTLNASVDGASNVTYFATNEAVTISDATVMGTKSGVAEVYALVDGEAYLAYTVTVNDYTGYKAIATLSDLKGVQSDGKYLMVADVDLGGVAGQIANAFSGIFDGNGHAIKNGFIYMGTNEGEAKRSFIGALKGGTLKNTAFIGWKTENGTNGTWQGAGILSNMDDNATVENLYIEMTVNGNGQNNCNGVLTASATGKNVTIRNIITNVTYTGEFNKFATITGGNPALDNVYAIVGREYKDKIPSKNDNPNNKEWNYASLAELQTTKPELFAEGGVFTGEFWEMVISDINKPVLKVETLEIYEGETFTDSDIFVKNRIDLTISSNAITYSDGTFTAGTVTTETEVTLTATYDGKEIKLTVTVKPITDITESGELQFVGATPYKIGDAVNASDFEATYNSNAVTVTDFKILKNSSEVSTFDGEGTYTVTATVTERGYKGILSCEIEIKRPVSVTCDKENADLTIYPTQTVSGSEYSDTTKSTVQLTVTASYTDEQGGAVTITGYVSKNEQIATVNESGLVTAVAGGTAEIYAVVNGQEYKVCTVTVKDYSDYKAISNVTDWNALPTETADNGNYVLVADIDFDGATPQSKFGTNGKLDNGMCGVFDGNGYAIKNFTTPSTTGGSNWAYSLIGNVKGTLCNVRFIGVNMPEQNKIDYYGGVIAFLTGTLENVYAEITVSGKYIGGVSNSFGSVRGGLIGDLRNDNFRMHNVIVAMNVKDNNFDYAIATGAIFGQANRTTSDRMTDCYAIVGDTDINAYGANNNCNGGYGAYKTLAELQAAKPELFAEGGIFTGEFWEKNIKDINRPAFKYNTLEVFECETFTDEDIFVNITNRVDVKISTTDITYSNGTFTAGAVTTETEVTLTATYDGKEIKLTVTVKPITDITESGELKFIGGTPYKMGDAVNASDFEATYNSNAVTVTDFKILKNSSEVSTFDGEGTYTVTATVTERGYKGTLSCNIEIKRSVTVSGAEGTVKFVLGVAETVSGSVYSGNTHQLNVTATYDDDSSSADITYGTKNSAVATVNETGLITAIATGSAQIYVTVNGQEYIVCTAEVKDFTGYKAIDSVADWNALPTETVDNGKYVLVADIDFGGTTPNSKFGSKQSLDNGMCGIFDGNGYAIKNFTTPSTTGGNSEQWAYSLFGNVKGTMRNIRFLGVNMPEQNKTNYYGGVIAFLTGTLENVYAEITVSGKYSDMKGGFGNVRGGLIGDMRKNNTLRNIIVVMNVKDNNSEYAAATGAIFGQTNQATSDRMTDCYAIVGNTGINAYGTNNNVNGGYGTYETFAALKAEQGSKFAEGGAFTGDFWKDVVNGLEQG